MEDGLPVGLGWIRVFLVLRRDPRNRERLENAAWRAFAYFNGIVGTMTMVASVVLTIYSLVLYLRRYAGVFAF